MRDRLQRDVDAWAPDGSALQLTQIRLPFVGFLRAGWLWLHVGTSRDIGSPSARYTASPITATPAATTNVHATAPARDRGDERGVCVLPRTSPSGSCADYGLLRGVIGGRPKRRLDQRGSDHRRAWRPEVSTPMAEADGASPRRVSRARSCSRALDSRLSTVPTGQPSCRATSSCRRPSMWQRTRGTRYRSGSRRISSSITDRNSTWSVPPSRPSTRPAAAVRRLPPRALGPLFAGNSQRHAVKPVREQVAVLKRTGLLHEHQERGLERVFCRMFVAQNATAHTQDHGPVSMDQDPERRFAALLAGQKVSNELAISPVSHRSPLVEGVNPLHCRRGNSNRHQACSRRLTFIALNQMRHQAAVKFRHCFSRTCREIHKHRAKNLNALHVVLSLSILPWDPAHFFHYFIRRAFRFLQISPPMIIRSTQLVARSGSRLLWLDRSRQKYDEDPTREGRRYQAWHKLIESKLVNSWYSHRSGNRNDVRGKNGNDGCEGARGFARGGRAGGRRRRTDQPGRHDRRARETPRDLPGKAKQDHASFQGAGQGSRRSCVRRLAKRSTPGRSACRRRSPTARLSIGRGGPSLQERDRRDAAGDSQGGRQAPPVDADHGGGQRRSSRGWDSATTIIPRSRPSITTSMRSTRRKWHPSRDMHDSFYTKAGGVLRTHTTAFQVRAMRQHKSPPIRAMTSGRCYRRDEIDATHFPIFNQLDVIAIDQAISFADLKWTLDRLIRALAGTRRQAPVSTQLFPVHHAERRGRCVLPWSMDGAPGLGHDPPGGSPQRWARSRAIPGIRVWNGDRSAHHGALRDRRHPAALRERGILSHAVLAGSPAGIDRRARSEPPLRASEFVRCR